MHLRCHLISVTRSRTLATLPFELFVGISTAIGDLPIPLEAALVDQCDLMTTLQLQPSQMHQDVRCKVKQAWRHLRLPAVKPIQHMTCRETPHFQQSGPLASLQCCTEAHGRWRMVNKMRCSAHLCSAHLCSAHLYEKVEPGNIWIRSQGTGGGGRGKGGGGAVMSPAVSKFLAASPRCRRCAARGRPPRTGSPAARSRQTLQGSLVGPWALR